jgi:hypothetical protein
MATEKTLALRAIQPREGDCVTVATPNTNRRYYRETARALNTTPRRVIKAMNRSRHKP